MLFWEPRNVSPSSHGSPFFTFSRCPTIISTSNTNLIGPDNVVTSAMKVSKVHFLFSVCQWSQVFVVRAGRLRGFILKSDLTQDARGTGAVAAVAKQ